MTDLQKTIEGAADEDLCRELGIDPKAVSEIASLAGPRSRPRYNPYSSDYNPHSSDNFYGESYEKEQEEATTPAETVMRTMVEYLISQDDAFWKQSRTSRKNKVDFIRESLMDVYDDLRKRGAV